MALWKTNEKGITIISSEQIETSTSMARREHETAR